MPKPFDPLLLENQLCFPLYSASKKIVKSYTPFLEPFDLTYTQYITLMVLWEKKELSIASLGEILHLDSGTLTPLIKKLIDKNLVSKTVDKSDRRMVCVCLTKRGQNLKQKMKDIPAKVGECFPLNFEESLQLRALLDKINLSDED